MYFKISLVLIIILIILSCQIKKYKPKTELLFKESIMIYNYIDNKDRIPIMGLGTITKKQFKLFFKKKNKYYSQIKFNQIVDYYISECMLEGINHDVAISQMFLETNFLKYTGDVRPYQNNFAGIGATGNKNPGNRFIDLQTGIRAHIQHLKAYASKTAPKRMIVDPRYNLINHGSCLFLKDLSGKWAVDKKYSEKIRQIIKKIKTIK